MGVSRFGNIRLGKDNESPAYSDFAWFSMLFCSGIGIGMNLRLRIARPELLCPLHLLRS